MKFWIPWSIDAVVAAILVGFFIIGIADRSVSSFNIGLWILILAVVLGVVAGSLSLRSANHGDPRLPCRAVFPGNPSHSGTVELNRS